MYICLSEDANTRERKDLSPSNFYCTLYGELLVQLSHFETPIFFFSKVMDQRSWETPPNTPTFLPNTHPFSSQYTPPYHVKTSRLGIYRIPNLHLIYL